MRIMSESNGCLSLSDKCVDFVQVHAHAKHMPSLPAGPIVRRDDGTLVSVAGHPAELSMSFSEDECESWSPPVVIARSEHEEKRPEVCYPYAFEAEPGTLWITAHRWGLRMRLDVADFIS